MGDDVVVTVGRVSMGLELVGFERFPKQNVDEHLFLVFRYLRRERWLRDTNRRLRRTNRWLRDIVSWFDECSVLCVCSGKFDDINALDLLKALTF